MDLHIDPEFASLLGGLSVEQETELVSLLEQEGWRPNERIIVWANHSDTIIDGHNRYRICKRLGIQFKTAAMVFATRDDVMKWMYRNQAGRRNITADELRYLRGKLYEAEKKPHGSAPGEARKLSKPQNADLKISTADAIGKEFGISGDTILRDARFAAQVDAEVAKVPDEQKAEKKAELLTKKKPKSKSKEDTSKTKKDEPMSWTEALRTASKKKNIAANELAEIMGKKAVPDCQKGLAILAQGRGFLVEKNGSKGSYAVRKALTLPVDEVGEDRNLLLAVKKKAIEGRARVLDGSNASVLWDVCLDVLRDIIECLKDVK